MLNKLIVKHFFILLMIPIIIFSQSRIEIKYKKNINKLLVKYKNTDDTTLKNDIKKNIIHTYFKLGQNYYKNKQYILALETYQHMINNYDIQDSAIIIETKNDMADIFYNNDNLKKALELYIFIHKNYPDSKKTFITNKIVNLCYKLEKIYEKRNDFNTAKHYLNLIIDSFPNTKYAAESEYFLIRKFSNQLKKYLAYTKKYPNSEFNEKVFFLIGKIYFYSGLHYNASKYFNILIDKYPNTIFKSKINEFKSNILLEKFTSINISDIRNITAINFYQDNILIGTYLDGLYTYNSTTSELIHITDNEGLMENTIRDIVSYRNKFIIGTLNGLNLFDPKTNKVDKILNTSGYKVKSILINKSNNHLLVGTINKGLIILDKDFVEIKRIHKYKILSAAEYQTSFLFGTTNGLLILDKDYNTEFKMKDMKITAFAEFCNEILIGTWGTGIYKSTKNLDSFQHYLNSENDTETFVTGIISYNNNRIFFSTLTNGLNVYNKEKQIVKKYTTIDGLISSNISKIKMHNNKRVYLGFWTSGLSVTSTELNKY